MGRRPALNAEQAEQVARRYSVGEGLEALAADYGVSYTAVRTAIRKTGAEFRKPYVTLSRKNLPRYGADNPSWTGDDATYNAKHLRVKLGRGIAHGPCSHCGTMKAAFRFEWAQLHGTTGTDPEHYIQLCHPCHEDYDVEKISAEQAEEIRALYFFGVKQTRLGVMYGVVPSYISTICTGKRRVRREGCER